MSRRGISWCGVNVQTAAGIMAKGVAAEDVGFFVRGDRTRIANQKCARAHVLKSKPPFGVEGRSFLISVGAFGTLKVNAPYRLISLGT